MDRIIVYPGAIPLDTDMLNTNRNTMTALHALIAATLGTATAVDGLAVTATSPASMTVVVGQGSITQYGPMDGTAYGSLGADTADSVVKMAVNVAPATFTLTAPTTAGTAIAYLIEGGFSETDQTPLVLPYYNAANPVQPYLGPGNSGVAQNTLRQQRVTLQLKAGAAAPVGGTVVPPVDPGFVALAAILVLAGATQVTAGSIGAAQTTRFTPWKLPDLMPGYAFSQAFTASGTFTVPNNVTRLRLSVIGAGGAGASIAAGGSGGGGGGGAGGRGEMWLTGMMPGSAIAVTVGAPGVAVAGAAGLAGGSSSFGAYCSATGGSGGSGAAGGLGGTAVAAAVTYPGSYGTDAVPGAARGGDGGAPGTGKGGSGTAPGLNATSYGGGGGGASGPGFGGGTGGGGLVVVEW
jgi:hypothetical protein